MKPVNATILTINGGSSSIKFALFEANDCLQRILEGGIERFGSAESALHVTGVASADCFSRQVVAPDYAAAIATLLGWLEERLQSMPLTAIGHRIVHGGPKYYAPQPITSQMLEDLRKLSSFDPEHLPGEILLAEACLRRFPNAPQVACFDTAFHHDLPRVAQLLPIPRRFEAQGVRRYGFHGLSYTFLSEELARLTRAETAHGRVIFAHLGNGASLAAVKGGKPIDTSMGFTPAAGLVMSSRSGDLDPGLFHYLTLNGQMTSAQFQYMVNHESGLIGLSETSSDMRELLNQEMRDIRAAEAVSVFCYQAKKWIGSFAAALGGLDALVFSGGIGENSPQIRSRICEGLEFLGIQLDEQENAKNESLISQPDAGVEVRVIHTNEELIIAKSTLRLLDLV
jgi:acetate kinase